MKKTTNKLLAMLLAVVMFAGILTGCGYDALGEKLGVTNDDTHQHENANTGDTDNSVNSENSDFQAQIDSINKQLADTIAAVETVKAENEALKLEVEESAKALETANGEKARLQTENDALTREVKASNSENEALLARIAELEKQLANSKPAVEVIDGTVFCDVDYFLEKVTVIFADGTAALKAIKDGIPVVVDDVHGIGNKAEYRDPTFNLPWKYENGGYNIAITFNETNVYYADFSNYHWASSSLWQRGAAKTGYPLKETKKHSSLGWFDEIINHVAVCVPNENAEFGYDFYVAVGYNDPNPYVCTHANGCHCGNCDKCPALEPEVQYQVVALCKFCGKQDCKGHVETKVETKTEYVDKCGRCGKLYNECICEPEIQVETKTEYVDKCGRCGKLYNECVCKPEIQVETKTEYVDKCGRCGKLYNDCVCKPEIQVETKTEYVDKCGRCGKLYNDCICEPEIKTEYIKYCGKCDHLLEDCICTDSDHNDLEDIPNPNPNPNPGNNSDHNDLGGNGGSTGSNHNGLEDIPDPNKSSSSNSSHSTSSDSSSNHNSSNSTTSSGHSPLD